MAGQSGAPEEKLMSAQDDICPVCKSSRYLNPSMRFLVNPECYHKMCESCVDRIFSHGPAACPVAGCHRTLRKQRFRTQTFEDINVEKEVDIRRRIAKTFNRREEEFETLLAYNNYLEEVETVTFNLLYGVDVEETEKKLAAHAAHNAASISRNAALGQGEGTDYETMKEKEREHARMRREQVRQEEEEARRIKVENKKQMLDLLANGKQADAAKLVSKSKVQLKQPSGRRKPGGDATTGASTTTVSTLDYQIKGLRSRTPPPDARDLLPSNNPYYLPPEKAGESRFEHFSPPDEAVIKLNPWLTKARTEPTITAGGYDVREYCQRALVEAFDGLMVFTEDAVEVGGN